jgi:hypothetical protein
MLKYLLISVALPLSGCDATTYLPQQDSSAPAPAVGLSSSSAASTRFMYLEDPTPRYVAQIAERASTPGGARVIPIAI